MELSQEVLQRRVFNQGIYDLHVRDYMLGQTERFIDKNRNVVDVGAAVGMYSTFWADKCNQLFAFEAVPEVFGELSKLDSQFDNVSLMCCAVSDCCGESEFYVDDKRLSNSSFRDLVGGQKIIVPVMKLDGCQNEFEEGLGDVGFIKIDVEGHELDVLNGAANLIERCEPTVMCEIYPKFNNGPVRDTFEFFFDRGYHCFYNIKASGLREVKSVEEGINIANDEKMISLTDGDFLFTKKVY